MLFILDATTLADKAPPVLIAGTADNGGGAIANGFTTPYQKMRAGLGLLTDAGGTQGRGHLVLDQWREPARSGPRLRRRVRCRAASIAKPGFTPSACDLERHAGRRRRRRLDVRLRARDRRQRHLSRDRQRNGSWHDARQLRREFRQAALCGRRRRESTTASQSSLVADFWGAFSDFGRQDEDQDLGAAGVFIIPERGNLVGGGKDGILYNLEQGRPRQKHLGPSVQSALRRNVPSESAERPRRACRRRRKPIRTGRSSISIATCRCRRRRARRITSTARRCTWKGRRAASCTCGARTSGSKRTTTISRRSASPHFALKGSMFASGAMDPPGGMPGGRLVVSSNGTTPNTGVVWGVYPTQGNANSNVVHGALVAYDATRVLLGGQAETALPQRRRTPPTTWGTSPSIRRRSLRTERSTSARSATRWCSTASEVVRSRVRSDRPVSVRSRREVRHEELHRHDRRGAGRLHECTAGAG